MSEIKVVPCGNGYPDCFHIIMPDGTKYSTELGAKHLSGAEALAKKAELEREKVDGLVPSSEASGKLDSELTAAQNATEQDADDASKKSAVETRPLAPTLCGKTGFAKTRQESIANACNLPVGHEGKCSNEKTEPVEQAVPPRPLEILCSFCGKPMSLYWHDKLEDAIACREKVEAGLPAPAAIEQARPQSPKHRPTCWGVDCKGCGQRNCPYPAAAAEPAPTPSRAELLNAAKRVIASMRRGECGDYSPMMDEFLDLQRAIAEITE